VSKKSLAFLLAFFLCAAALTGALAQTLRKGVSGEEVLKLKQRMLELGYYSSDDFNDRFNDTMVERVKRLQKKNGLRQSGQVDEALYELIFSDRCIAADGGTRPTAVVTPSPTPGPTPVVTPVPTIDPDAMDDTPPMDVPGAPERDEKGFLTEENAEFTVSDMENGFWAYLSRTLQVVIHRRQDKQSKIIWFECDVRTCGAERMKALFSEKNSWQYPLNIARQHNAVLAFSDDFHAYRRYNKQTIGIVIRDGKIISDKTKSVKAGGFPKLENMAYFADGTLKCYNAGEHTAQEFLDMGATDVLAFGPILVTDGKLGEHMRETEAEAKKHNFYHYHEPRMALGMVAPGHYIVLDVTGRTSKLKARIPGVSDTSKSNGVYLDWVALKMLELGATEAINLDGGWTTSLCFMGESLNMKYSSSRKTTHIMSFGQSTLAGGQ